MPAQLIPKPRKLSTRIMSIDGNTVSLAQQMRLDGSKSNRRLYFDILNGTGMLCEAYFPLKESRTGSWKAKPIVRVLAPKLLKRFPILRNYVDHWPITVLVSRHYSLCQAGSKAGLIRLASSSQTSEKTIGPNMSTCSMGALGNDNDAGKLPYTQDSAICKGKDYNHDDNFTEAAPSSSPSQTLTSENSPSVVHFLNTLAQDLSNLLPVFIDHGVGDSVSLRSMLRMNNWQAWMYAWVKEGVLTELQFQMIVNGLKKLA